MRIGAPRPRFRRCWKEPQSHECTRIDTDKKFLHLCSFVCIRGQFKGLIRKRRVMQLHSTAEFQTTIQWIAPAMIAIVFILLISLMKEPNRRLFMAIILGGAGSAYLSGGGFGKWEMAFSTVMTICAYQGLRS